ncbi:MAG: DUF4062 domain-containing protein [Litorimonas sp.]
MDKRYQIFVSSTFADLKEERQIIMRTLMEMGHFPSGMEFFSAIDEEQWPFIEKIIDDSDYYVLILGGRYGSLADEQISYTEKEFDYARDNNKKIIALVHGSPDSLPVSKTDGDNALADKLKNFRRKVCTGRMIKFWTKPEELAGHVALALPKTIQLFPAIGWVRADKVASQEILEQINSLRTRNEVLEREQSRKSGIFNFDNISDLDSKYQFVIREMARKDARSSYEVSREVEITKSWKELFFIIADTLESGASLGSISVAVVSAHKIPKYDDSLQRKGSIEGKYLKQIIYQLEGLNLIRNEQYTRDSTGATFRSGLTTVSRYFLSDIGKRVFLDSKIIKSKSF